MTKDEAQREMKIRRLDRAYTREMKSDRPDWNRVEWLRIAWVAAVLNREEK